MVILKAISFFFAALIFIFFNNPFFQKDCHRMQYPLSCFLSISSWFYFSTSKHFWGICTTPLLLVSEAEVKDKGYYSLVGEVHQQVDNVSLMLQGP